MAGIEIRGNGKQRRFFIRLSEGEHPKRPRIAFGRINKKQAETAKLRIEELIRAKNSNSQISIAAQEWLMEASEPIRKRLEMLELTKHQKSKAQITLREWVNRYIKVRTDLKPSTVEKLEIAKNDLLGFCDQDMAIKAFTASHAEEFRISLLDRGLAENTVRRRCRRCKQFFNAAIKRRLIFENPFDGIRTVIICNPKRQRFISHQDMQKVIEACPNNRWRLIFVLARYGGLRIPSELTRLKWADILWDQKRFIIHSPKTKFYGKEQRICPLFPEIEQCLLEAYDQAEPGEKKIFDGLLDKNNLRTHACRIIKKAGLVPWPKLFQNLRSSRETELVEKFPVHVVVAWLGNTPSVAQKHYLQTHEEHFKRAVENSGLNMGLTAPVLDRTESPEQNSGKPESELTPCGAGTCEDMPSSTISDTVYPSPRVGLEPTT